MSQILIHVLIIALSIFILSSAGNLIRWTNETDFNINSIANDSDRSIQTIGGGEKIPKDIGKPINSTRKSQKRKNYVTNEELERLSEDLFNKDVNNAWRYITINLQNKTMKNSSIDKAPEPLLTIDPEAFEIPTINLLLQMYDNYHLDTRKTEEISSSHREEQDHLLDAFLDTEVMSTAMEFLSDNDFLPRNESSYRESLKSLWFSPYGRAGGNSSSSGFEHVFLNELKRGKQIIGLHNWIYFNSVESEKKANYLGYLDEIHLGDKAAILALHFTFNSHEKPITSIFIGTSPELEMALYTICFYARRGKKCNLSLGGSKFLIITYQLTDKGKNLPVIASAFPQILFTP